MPATLRLKRKPPKYRAVHCWLTPDGVIHRAKPAGPNEHFHSLKECRRWLELKALEAAGGIKDLRRPEPIPLHAYSVDGTRAYIGDYEADAFYFEGGKPVWEDTKGRDRKGRNVTATDLYLWKKKHVEMEYGIVIRET